MKLFHVPDVSDSWGNLVHFSQVYGQTGRFACTYSHTHISLYYLNGAMMNYHNAPGLWSTYLFGEKFSHLSVYHLISYKTFIKADYPHS